MKSKSLTKSEKEPAKFVKQRDEYIFTGNMKPKVISKVEYAFTNPSARQDVTKDHIFSGVSQVWI